MTRTVAVALMVFAVSSLARADGPAASQPADASARPPEVWMCTARAFDLIEPGPTTR